MKVKIQEYLRNEKYYIIKTNQANQYLGLSYNPFDNKIIFQNFGQKQGNSSYFTPNIQKKFTLKLTEVELLLKNMTVLWNAAKKDLTINSGIYNKSFGIRTFGDYDVNIQIKKDILDFKYISITKQNKVDLPEESFDIYLDYMSSRTLYAILKQLVNKKEVIVETEENTEEVESYA